MYQRIELNGVLTLRNIHVHNVNVNLHLRTSSMSEMLTVILKPTLTRSELEIDWLTFNECNNRSLRRRGVTSPNTLWRSEGVNSQNALLRSEGVNAFNTLLYSEGVNFRILYYVLY